MLICNEQDHFHVILKKFYEKKYLMFHCKLIYFYFSYFIQIAFHNARPLVAIHQTALKNPLKGF